MHLQTWKELYHRDTETPARSIPSTYSFCLSAWAPSLASYHIHQLQNPQGGHKHCALMFQSHVFIALVAEQVVLVLQRNTMFTFGKHFFSYVPHEYLGGSSDPCSWGFPAAQNRGWHVTQQCCKSSCQLQKFSRSWGLAKSTLPGGSWGIWLSEASAALHFVVASRCRRVRVYINHGSVICFLKQRFNSLPGPSVFKSSPSLRFIWTAQFSAKIQLELGSCLQHGQIARLFMEVHGRKARASGHKLNQSRFWLYIKRGEKKNLNKNSKALGQVAQRGGGHQGVFKTQLNKALSNPSKLSDLPTLETSHGPFQSEQYYNF